MGNGIKPSRIVLGGFSQGGALALYTGLRCTYKLGGIFSMSAWLPVRDKFPDLGNDRNFRVPILQQHGDCDTVVSYKWGQLTSKTLKKFVKNHEFTTYRFLTHSTNNSSLKEAKAFVERHVPEKIEE